jgi:hypothetical protein
LDEDACANAILAYSIEDRLVANIVEFEFAHQMWVFRWEHYEPDGQSTYLAGIRQEQLLRRGDSTVDEFFAQVPGI